MLFPPGAVPGEVEGQELTVLVTKERDKLESGGSRPLPTTVWSRQGLRWPVSLYPFLLGFSCVGQNRCPNLFLHGKA